MEIIVILALLGFIIYREIRHDKHIKELEDRIMSPNLPTYYQSKKIGDKSYEPNNLMARETTEELIGDIPFMEMPKDYRIETEESPTTPSEARARADE